MIDYNPDSADRWERPPVRADFILVRTNNTYSFTVYNIHTKPDNVSLELGNLESLVNSQTNHDNIIILGDLNADCYYYTHYSSAVFFDWNWIINDDSDTTSGNSNCAYDRIILNKNAYDEFIITGIDSSDINEKVSDHYLVWALIRDYDYVKDKTFKAYIQYLSTWL
jgi:hypothetical protein